MTVTARKPHFWSEFMGDNFGWEVVLNATGFPHTDLLFSYAEAYRRAAHNLFESFRQAEVGRDMDMLPIIFLYRHAVEVSLKTILWEGEGVLLINGRPLRTAAKIFKGHNLKEMLPGVGQVLGLLDCSKIWVPPTFSSFADIERVVIAINEIQHEAFRYPIDRSGRKELLEHPLRFDALVFTDKAEALLGVLESAAIRANEAFQKYFTDGTAS